MFEVQPVRSKELQSQLAALLSCEYYSDTYAFFAGELDEDCTTITSLIALCQFTYAPDKAEIKSLSFAPGCERDEAVIILVRTVMNFIYRAEIPIISIDSGAADEEFIKALGFRDNGGEWQIDLKKFYRSPCHYNDNEKA
ncbi:MAG: hypothetical protein ACI4XJ_10290 [Eubacteriales bacterium]